MLADYLGVDQVLWFAGGIAGNDADGYVDDVTRFVAPQLIVAVFENDPTKSVPDGEATLNFQPSPSRVKSMSAVFILKP